MACSFRGKYSLSLGIVIPHFGFHDLGLTNFLENPFEGVTQRQRDFILTITSALAKYESETTFTSGERGEFSSQMDRMLIQLQERCRL